MSVELSDKGIWLPLAADAKPLSKNENAINANTQSLIVSFLILIS